ncbi:MAG: hypothetical protein F4020_00490 [Gammaproteobacteria bacterium]|nr:hypothetical protein [Gammaproteobacteria bacterium]MYK68085.1 hypothetical protein [Gammaproteobacteria bacterium]
MNDIGTSKLLLTHLSWRFHPPMEVLACTVLEYILNHHPDSREGLNDLLSRIVPGMRLSGMEFETEIADPELGRLDVLQRGDDGEGRFVIEAKFDASLMSTQPVSYLDQLPEAGVSALMFLVPTLRVEELWPLLLGRLDGEGIAYAQLEYPRCVRIDGTEKHLCIIDWTTLLDSMKEPLAGDEVGRADLRQLRGLARFAEAKESKARLPGEEMVNAVVKLGKAAGWLATTTMRGGAYGITRQGGDYGRYARLDRLYKLGIWLGINSRLHRKFASTPLWVMCTDWAYADGQGWNPGVKAILEARMGPELHEAGKTLWVPVAPEGGRGPDRYAAALERIVGILDELAEPWQSDAIVLEEVSRPYKQRVMNNVHRSEHVEAVVGLALKASGWARMTPWDSWDLEHKSGVRLEVKQSAAAQAWKSPERQNPARFDIAPRTGYWDKKGDWVSEPGRHADLYVFAWHGADGDTADQRDPGSWEFYVVAERDLPEQKSIGLTVLQELASPCGIDALAAGVDAIAARVGAAPEEEARS